jgi:hypothetical protein
MRLLKIIYEEKMHPPNSLNPTPATPPRPPRVRTGAEEAWLHAALTGLRRLVPDRQDDEASASPSTAAAAANDATADPQQNASGAFAICGVNVGTSFVDGEASAPLARAQAAFARVVTRARLDMPLPRWGGEHAHSP